ncbi:uncharacterized protein LOC133527148 isoform X1 [Cydia pomonella]|uniref:uncharacterized protein LOC133527148 isoform X1 n=1 Tax=Cydia pomonella TaxID=82600 RepID=UPI002ADE0F27|nr:uncharacterized protein LOC133527148 isoform X1 [Cydia pomonella]
MIYSRPWTNLILLMAIKMVLCGAGVAGDVLTNANRERRTPRQHHRAPIEEEWKRSHWREMHQLLVYEARNHSDGVDCCPTVHEMTAPQGGRTLSGLFVELYRDGENNMQLYEISCAAGVVDKPCRFVDARLYNQSRCVQKYSYSYALVRPYGPDAATENPHRHRRERQGMAFKKDGEITVSGGWSMDYVQVRSGCECQIIPTLKPRKKNQHKNKIERREGKKTKELVRERKKYKQGDET